MTGCVKVSVYYLNEQVSIYDRRFVIEAIKMLVLAFIMKSENSIK